MLVQSRRTVQSSFYMSGGFQLPRVQHSSDREGLEQHLLYSDHMVNNTYTTENKNTFKHYKRTFHKNDTWVAIGKSRPQLSYNLVSKPIAVGTKECQLILVFGSLNVHSEGSNRKSATRGCWGSRRMDWASLRASLW